MHCEGNLCALRLSAPPGRGLLRGGAWPPAERLPLPGPECVLLVKVIPDPL